MHHNPKIHIGVISNAAAPATREVLGRLRECLAKAHMGGSTEVLVEALDMDRSGAAPIDTGLRLYDAARRLLARGATCILLPCPAHHAFASTLSEELGVYIPSMADALDTYASRCLTGGANIGILSSELDFRRGPFGANLPSRLVRPRAAIQHECVEAPLHARGQHAAAFDPKLLQIACDDLSQRGAHAIVAGSVETALLAPALRIDGARIVDLLGIYFDHALAEAVYRHAKPFKLGVVGGIGPAATVDFLDKLVRATPATKDQDHIKVLVDQNPQIPDRTAHLQHRGADPALALYAACHRLRNAGASVIVLPCNTAHAYLDRLQRGLPVPIVDMPAETVAHIVRSFPACRRIGLLATSGTVNSGVYSRAAAKAAISLLTPEPAWQDKVMRAIYGPRGIKAGYRDGECVSDLLEAADHLAQRGADLLVLGCTELPLMFNEMDALEIGGRCLALVDPAALVAQLCVALARRHDQDALRSKRAGANGAGSANGVSSVMSSASKRPVAGPSVSP